MKSVNVTLICLWTGYAALVKDIAQEDNHVWANVVHRLFECLPEITDQRDKLISFGIYRR